MSSHKKEDLDIMMAMPLGAKIQATKRRIMDWYDYWDGMVYVSFSGGKDSTVLKHIVDSMELNIPSVFVDTGLEYPEIRQFVKTHENVEWLRPDLSFSQTIYKYGYPVISKENAEAIRGARMCLKEIKKGSPKPRYHYYYRRVTGTGEYASRKSIRMSNEGQQEGGCP